MQVFRLYDGFKAYKSISQGIDLGSLIPYNIIPNTIFSCVSLMGSFFFNNTSVWNPLSQGIPSVLFHRAQDNWEKKMHVSNQDDVYTKWPLHNLRHTYVSALIWNQLCHGGLQDPHIFVFSTNCYMFMKMRKRVSHFNTYKYIPLVVSLSSIAATPPRVRWGAGFKY